MMIQPPTQSAKKPSPERTRAYQAPHLAVLRQQGPAAATASPACCSFCWTTDCWATAAWPAAAASSGRP